MIFGSAGDPAVIDGALVSDGESLRVVQQIFESLMKIKEGTTEVEPNLAVSATPNDDGTEWTLSSSRTSPSKTARHSTRRR